MGPFRSTLLTSLGCALAFVLAACGGSDPTPIVAPPSSTAPSTPAPSDAGPQTPRMPTVAEEHTKRGAIAFARYYWDVADYAQRTGDTRVLQSLTPDSCEACAAGLKFINHAYRGGGRIDGGTTTVGDIAAAPLNLPGGYEGYSMKLTLRNTKQRVIGPDGHTRKVFPAAKVRLLAVVRASAQGWEMDSWQSA